MISEADSGARGCDGTALVACGAASVATSADILKNLWTWRMQKALVGDSSQSICSFVRFHNNYLIHILCARLQSTADKRVDLLSQTPMPSSKSDGLTADGLVGCSNGEVPRGGVTPLQLGRRFCDVCRCCALSRRLPCPLQHQPQVGALHSPRSIISIVALNSHGQVRRYPSRITSSGTVHHISTSRRDAADLSASKTCFTTM